MFFACRKVGAELIEHHRWYHCKYINQWRLAPRIYAVGDHVFAKRSVKSDAKQGSVGEIMNAFTGPWEIITIGHGSSCGLKHVVNGKLGKSHAAHLSPFPCQLIPF